MQDACIHLLHKKTKDMKVLILGASGFIGNYCSRHFSQTCQVTGIDTLPGASTVLIDHDATLTVKEITKASYDLLLNCAGSSNVLQSFADPQRDFELNTMLVQKILKTIHDYSPHTKLINISSAAVYGNPKTLPIRETDELQPLSPYGLHKKMSEEFIDSYGREYHTKALSVRIFSAYGEGLRRQFFYDLYTKFQANTDSVELAGTGKESRDFICVSDIANALQILAQKAEFKGEVYNLASGEESFIGATAELFAEICGYKGEICFTQKQFEGYPLNWRADITRLKQLGFEPKTKLEDGLKQYADYLKTAGL